MTTPPPQQTELRRVYYQCRLGRSELDRLFAVAAEGIPDTGITVSTQRGDTRFRQSDLSSLLDAVSQANVPGDPNQWSNITFEAEGENESRKVSIAIDQERVEMHLAGSDATWAYGQKARLEKLLEGAGGLTKARRDKQDRDNALIASGITSAMLSGIAVVYPLAYGKPKSRDDFVATCLEQFSNRRDGLPLWVTVTAAILFLGLAVAFFVSAMLKRRMIASALVVNGEVSTGSWWSNMSTSNKVAIIGLPIALMAAIATSVSALTDAL
ncbi:hypothetical protein ACWD0D_23760 [Streptomyces griseoincarnatus]